MIQYIPPKMLTDASQVLWAKSNQEYSNQINNIIDVYLNIEGTIKYDVIKTQARTILMPTVEVNDVEVANKINDVINEHYHQVPIELLID